MIEIAIDLQNAVNPTEENSDEPFASTVQKLNTGTHDTSNSLKVRHQSYRNSNVMPPHFSSRFTSITLVM